MLCLKKDFKLQPFQAKFSHHPKMSTQESLLVTTETEAMLGKGAIQERSLKELLWQSLLSKEKGYGGWGQQTCNKLKKSECFHSLPSCINPRTC